MSLSFSPVLRNDGFLIMASTGLLEILLRGQYDSLTKKEKLLLEIVFFKYLHEELQYSFSSTKRKNKRTEKSMLNGNVIRVLINDLLTSEEYSIEGLANYTGYSEDVIYDVAAGINDQPTLALSTKIIELHSVARQDIYNTLITKVIKQVITPIIRIDTNTHMAQ